MAYSYLAMARTTLITAIEREAKSLALLSGTSTSLDFLAYGTSAQNLERLNIINQAERELIADFPQLFNSTTTVTTTAATRTTALPTTMWWTDIKSVRWTDGSGDNQAVVAINPRDRDSLPAGWLLDTYQQTYPSFYYLADLPSLAGPAIYWIGIPSGAVSASVEYRVRPTAFSSGDLTSPATIAATPDDMIELLCLGVARRYAKRRGIEFRGLARDLENDRIQLRDEWVGRISSTADMRATGTRGPASSGRDEADDAYAAFQDEEYFY
jgi:hypothetical protein